MNKLNFAINCLKILVFGILFICISNNSFAATCSTNLPPISNNDDLIIPYIKNIFSMQNCDDNDVMTVQTEAENGTQNITVKLGNNVFINIIEDPKNKNKYLVSSSSSQVQDNYIIQDLLLFPKVYDKLLCLSYPTIEGSMPLICKPYNVSNDNANNDPAKSQDPCYSGKYSMYSVNFSGRVVHCIKDTLDGVFFNTSLSTSSIANFSDFQHSLQQAIFAALLLYIIFFGIKLILEPSQASSALFAKFVLKFIIVLYFTIGLNVAYWNGDQKIENGFIKQGLPFFTSMSWSLASVVLDSSDPGGLCNFSKVEYKPGMEFYRLWDSIDCRLFTYLGVTGPDILPHKNYLPKLFEGKYALKFLMVLCGLFLAGNVFFFIAAIIFLTFFLSLIIFFISTFCVYLITLYVMAYISPIFIPMVLFEKTKGYFDAWLKICISCALQPAILASFIALMLGLYDEILYEDCLFVPDGGYSEIVKNFDFASNISDDCKKSFGYKMVQYYSGEGWDTQNLLIIKVNYLQDTFNATEKMIYVMFFCVVTYFFSQSLTAFAASITGGPNVGGVSVGPMALVDYLTRKLEKKPPAEEDKKELSKDKLENNKELSKDKLENNKESSEGGGLNK